MKSILSVAVIMAMISGPAAVMGLWLTDNPTYFGIAIMDVFVLIMTAGWKYL